MVVKKKAKSTEKNYVTDSSIPIKQFYVKSTKKQTKEKNGQTGQTGRVGIAPLSHTLTRTELLS